MINRMLSLLGIRKMSTTLQDDSRRKHIRHTDFRAEVTVGNRTYNVRDWGMGGVFFETTPDARLMAGDRIPTTIKFSFPHETIVVHQPARIIRTSRRGGVAAEFSPLPKVVRHQFERILDNLNTQSFLESQVA